MMDRRLIENFDWPLLMVLLAIISIGMLSLYSALNAQIQASPTHNLFVRQMFLFLIGFAVMFAALSIDYQRIKALSQWIYALSVLLLILVLIFGKEVNGSRRWLMLGSFGFQPSELMKSAIVIQLAAYYSSQEIQPFPHFRKLLVPFCYIALPVGLILAESDLGTALCVLAIAATVILFMGIRWQYVVTMVLGVLPLIWPVWVHLLKPYQKRRILILLRPDLDPLGAGYHIRQSKIAIGSGMTWGKGFLKGTQSKLRFLPEKHTDFIFSVWAEEWGFLGSVVLLVLFGLMIALAMRVARRSKDRFGALLVVGMTGVILWQVVINIGMVIGVLPVVGITLPFVSYGGTSLVSLCFAIGIIENVSMRRYVFRARKDR